MGGADSSIHVAGVVREEGEAAPDLLDYKWLTEEVHAATLQLRDRGVEVVYRDAKVVHALGTECVGEVGGWDLQLGLRAPEDFDLDGAVAEVSELHVAEGPFLVEGEVELRRVPIDRSVVIDDPQSNVVVAQLQSHAVILVTGPSYVGVSGWAHGVKPR